MSTGITVIVEDSQIDTLNKDNIDFICYKCSGSTPPYGNLPEVAVTQPHAAYTAFTHVFLHRWSYIARMVPMATDLFYSLDDILSLRFFACFDWPTSIWSN